MFFILSKLLAFLLKPLTWMVALALFGFFTKNKTWRKKSIAALTVMLLVFTNPWLANELARAWETGKRNPDTIIEPYEVGIVLGGYANFNAASPPGVLTFHQAGNRLMAALALYQTGKVKRLLLSGGAGQLLGDAPPEADAVRAFLLQCAVPDSAILVENRSRNTHENAEFSKQMLDSIAPPHRYLLITSSWHIRRAAACFDKTGLRCDTFGTDYLTETNRGNWLSWLEPDWKALLKWELLLKEWAGWLAYRAKGYV